LTHARALIATAKGCTPPPTIEVYAVSDKALHDALAKSGAKLGQALAKFALLRTSFGFIGNRAFSDFVAIDLKGDLARACVKKGQENISAANAKLENIQNADPTIRKSQTK
jgi:hypothetical protein